MRVLKQISDKEFAVRLKEARTDAPINAESKAASAPRKLVADADLERLREIVNRARWDAGLATKLSQDEIIRLVMATPSPQATADPEAKDDDEEEGSRERDWLCPQYDGMGDRLLLDQIGRNEEPPSRLAGDLEELLDWSETPRRDQIRSRLIDYLVDRELAA
jgi:hypothetical protein